MKTLRACCQAKITSSTFNDTLLDPVVSSVNTASIYSENHLCTNDFNEDSFSQHAPRCKESVM